MDGGAIVVHVCVQLHVAHPAHGEALEDLLDPLAQVAPDLVEVVVLVGRLVGRPCHRHPDDVLPLGALHQRI